MEHERSTSPLMWTEQAPHRPMPQPYLVPVSPACSRRAQSRGVSPSTVRVSDLPLTFNLATFRFPRLHTPSIRENCRSELPKGSFKFPRAERRAVQLHDRCDRGALWMNAAPLSAGRVAS